MLNGRPEAAAGSGTNQGERRAQLVGSVRGELADALHGDIQALQNVKHTAPGGTVTNSDTDGAGTFAADPYNLRPEYRRVLLELGAIADIRLRAEGGFEALQALCEARIHTGNQALLERYPHAEGEDAEAEQQGSGVPRSKPLADGDAHHWSWGRRR
jgi:hypothetical protein